VNVLFITVRPLEGGSEREDLPVFQADLGALLRWNTPIGVVWLEAGWEYGRLDTFPAQGTLGGIYGLLGWSFSL
jgi:hypothetical protein